MTTLLWGTYYETSSNPIAKETLLGWWKGNILLPRRKDQLKLVGELLQSPEMIAIADDPEYQQLWTTITSERISLMRKLFNWVKIQTEPSQPPSRTTREKKKKRRAGNVIDRAFHAQEIPLTRQ